MFRDTKAAGWEIQLRIDRIRFENPLQDSFPRVIQRKKKKINSVKVVAFEKISCLKKFFVLSEKWLADDFEAAEDKLSF